MSEIQASGALANVRETGFARERATASASGTAAPRAVATEPTRERPDPRVAEGERRSELEDAIRRVRERLPQRVSREVRFVVDRERERVVIEVVDRETDQIIRRIPPEELLALADRMEELRGLLLRDRA